MNIVKKFIIAGALFAFIICRQLSPVLAADAPGLDTSSMFYKANENYNAGKYQKAAELYEAVLSKKQNGYLYYNLGNAYFKLNKPGLALLNYRRAQKLIPRFEDLLSNIKYARQETKDKIENKGYSQIIKRIFFWYYLFNEKELLLILLVVNLMFFLLAGTYIYLKTDFLKWLLIMLGILYFSSGATVLTRIYQEKNCPEGVVTSAEVTARSGYGINNVILFKLHEGTEFMIKDTKGDWLKIQLADGKKGWIKNSGADII